MRDIERLFDDSEITQALGRFARIIDQRHWSGLPEVFAEDVVFDYGAGGEQSGIAQLRTTMASYLDVCGGTQHLIGSIMVEFDGEAAISRSYVQARHQRPGEASGAVFDSNGEYIDRWARGPAGWRIVRRDVVWATHSGEPAILGIDADGLG